MEKMFLLVLCHIFGDYFLQTDFIANTKGQNWYHLFVHCFLYIVPFVFIFGFTWQLAIIFFTHVVIDSLKARYKKISYTQDQLTHYLLLLVYLI